MSIRAALNENSLARRWRRDKDGATFADAIFDTIAAPMLVLDKDLHIVAANRSFCLALKTNARKLEGSSISVIGNGQWNNPELLSGLMNFSKRRALAESWEIEQTLSGIGPRTMLLSARRISSAGKPTSKILLAIEDVTERRAQDREFREILQKKELLLRDMQHRVGNSLQIIASILLITARTVCSDETRLHLQAAHQRVMSVASVQQQLRASENGGMVELAPYLSRLCETLAESMIGDRQRITLTARIEGGATSSNRAISLGLIVTELVINAFKHAFPGDLDGGRVIVDYEGSEPNWTLSVSDNGIGSLAQRSEKTTAGLGTTIIEALAKQLDACMEVSTGKNGTKVSITPALAWRERQATAPRPPWGGMDEPRAPKASRAGVGFCSCRRPRALNGTHGADRASSDRTA